MSDDAYINVTFYILGDVIDDQIYNHIIGALSKIDGIISTIHPQKTNTIEVSAKWKEPEFDKKIESIRKIANVKDIKIYKKNRLFIRSMIDNVTVSDNVSWNLKKEPIGEVTRAKDDREYYKAISLSCTLFQNYGREILLWQSNNRGTRVAKKQLEHLKSIICELYAQNIIDQTIYKKINDVRNLRNELQHTDRAINYSSSQAEEAEKIIDNALECLKFLKRKYDSIK
jgi:hypothetical protein